MRPPTGRILLLAALLMAVPGAGHAQHRDGAGITLAAVGVEAVRGDSTAIRVSAAVLTRALPNSIHVVEVPVPLEFRGVPQVPYLVLPSGTVPLLGRHAGVITPDSSGDPVGALISFSIPRRARAGAIEVARVRFNGNDDEAIEVPVHVIIEPTQAIELTAGEALRGVRPGDRFQLTYRVTNLGNQAESITIRALLPAGWRATSGDGETVSLGINGTTERALQIAVPFTSATGSATVRLVALREGVPQATALASIEVVPDLRAAAGSGPLLTTGMVVGGSEAGVMTGFAAALEGPVAPGVRISANLSEVSGVGAGGYSLLSQLGYYRRPASLSLQARSWELGLGLTSARFSDLTGNNATGRGVAVALRWGALGLETFTARPEHGGRSAGAGQLTGVRAEARLGSLEVATTATRLVDQGFGSRRLDAIGMGAVVPAVLQGRLNAEVAQRWYGTGSGLGYALGYERQKPGSQLSLRAIYAPGGSGAWARATTEVAVAGSRNLTDWLAMHGSYWYSEDEAGQSFGAIRSSGWSTGTSLAPTRNLRVGVSGRSSSFDARTSQGAFGTSESGMETSLDLRVGPVTASGSGSISAYQRRTAIGSDAVVEEATRLGLYSSIGIGGAAGTLVVSGQFHDALRGDASVPQQGELGVRAEHVPLVSLGRTRLLASGGMRRNFLPGLGLAQTTWTAALSAELFLGVSVGFSAERNPFFVTSQGTGGWVYGLRVQRSTSLPGFAEVGSRGLVFQDLNGNGRQDRFEPGMPGVMVRRGSESAVSGPDGGYRFAVARPDPVTIDPLSLNTGWIVGGTVEGKGLVTHAVIAVAPVRVAIELASGLTGVSRELLAEVVVLAQHESGRVWVARKVGLGQAIFEALPAGRYVLELDLAEVREPLELDGGQVSFVTEGRVPVTIEVRLRPRPISIRQLDMPRTDSPAPRERQQ